MARTNAPAVAAILGDNYEAGRNLAPFIRAANLLTSRVVTCATAKGVTLSTEEQAEIEGWLAAHFYTRSDPTYKSRSTASASGAFNTDGTEYSKGAIALDVSGCLDGFLNQNSAGGFWLGKAPSEQINYEDRD